MKKITYLNLLNLAINSALDNNSPAWIRTIEKVENSNGSYSLEALQETKEALRAEINEYIENWFRPIYDKAVDKTNLFDLEMSPEELWKLMVYYNTGIFKKENGDPLLPFLTTLPSTIPGEGPLYFSPNLDGWGIKEETPEK